MDIAAAGGAFITAGTVALLSILAGFVGWRLIGGFITGDMELLPAVAALAGLFGVLGLTLLSWGSPLMLLPGPLALVGVVAWVRWVGWLERRSEAAWLAEQEARARALLERDPTAGVAYEQLADVLERRQRFDEALSVLLAWCEIEPHHPGLHHRVNRLRREMNPDIAPMAPPPPPVPERRAPQPDAPLLAGEPEPEPPPPPPPPRLREEPADWAPDRDAALAFDPDHLPDND